MKFLLTGATGFIGSHVAETLRRQGHELGQPADIGIHLAWYVEPGQYLESPLNDQCRDDSLTLIKSTPCRRWVVAGTCFEQFPTSRYARCKDELRRGLEQLDIELAWTRIFYLYGPREHPRRFVPSVINALLDGRPARLTAGDEVRDFLHVRDVAEALCAVALSNLTGIINIGSGQPVTVRELASEIAGIIGRPELLQFGAYQTTVSDPPVVVADVTRLRSVWQPQITLRAGLQQTVAWWRQQRTPTPPAH
ncbi:MAG: GDP-L-fucose synthase [Verrucomicrobiae bacterium]|nr:GDP-L-fucose synthase [Verrucomicrobiae bacterium]